MSGIGSLSTTLALDISNYVAGLQRAGQVTETEVNNMARLVKALTRQVGDMNKAAQEADGIKVGGQQMLSSLKDEVALFGKSEAAVLRYNAAKRGVGAEASPLILQLEHQKAAQEAAAKAARDEAAAQREASAAKEANESRQKRFLSGVNQEAAMQGKTYSERLRMQAAELGLAKEAEASILAIEKHRDKLGGTGFQDEKTMRRNLIMLGPQVTDIFTSLAGGQNPMLVAIQQGGQMRDIFGGFKPMFDVVKHAAVQFVQFALKPMVLAFTALATGALVVYEIFKQVKDEQNAFSAAIVKTNNAAGLSKTVLQDYARQSAAVYGTVGASAEAMAALISTGRVSGAVLVDSAQIAVRSQALLGTKIDETVKTYAALGKDPVQTLLRLNDGTNFLTASVLKQVMAYKSNLQNVEAANLAQEAYNAQQKRILDDAEKSMHGVEMAWMRIKKGAKEAWDAMLNIGRPQSLKDQLAAVELTLNNLKLPPRRGTLLRPGVRNSDVAEEHKENILESMRKNRQAQTNAQEEADAREEAVAKLTASRQAAVANQKKAVADQWYAVQVAFYATVTRETNERFQEAEISASDHQKTLYEITRQGIQAELELNSRKKNIESSILTGSPEEAAAKEVAMLGLRTQRLAIETKLRQLEQDERLGKRDITPFASSIGPLDALKAFKPQDEANVGEYLRGRREADAEALVKLKAELVKYNEETERLIGLSKTASQSETWASEQRSILAKNTALSNEEREREIRLINEAAAARKNAENIDRNRPMGEAVGLSITKYFQDIGNSTKMAESIVTGSFSRMEDAIVNWAKTGKLSFSALFSFMAEEYIRNMVRMAAQNLLINSSGNFVGFGALFSSFLGGGGGTAAAASVPLATGMSYVPYDNFPASLHKGERVMTAAENRGSRDGMNFDFSGQTLQVGQGVSRAEVDAVVAKRNAELEARMRRLNRQGVFG